MAKSSLKALRKMDKTSVKNLKSGNKFIDLAFIFVILAFMLIIPFYRGLFFRENYIPSIIILGFIFVAYSVYKLYIKSPITLNTYMDFAFICIPIIYLLSFFSAVNAKDAFDQFLIYSAYFMIYKMSSSIVQQDNKYRTYFVNGIILSTFILSLVGILDIAGAIDLKVAFVGKRYFGLYQYPNTTASVLGVGIILTLNAIINEENANIIPIYQVALTSVVVSFIFTISRGAYLVVAAIMLINFLILDAREKFNFILSILISFLSSSYLIYKFYTLQEADLPMIGNLYIYAIIVSGIMSLLIHSLKKFIHFKISDRVVNFVLILIIIVLASSAVALFSIKEPIEYRVEHKAGEKESWKSNSIYIDDLEPNNEYIFSFDVFSSKESGNSYRVVIRSYNEANEYEKILDERGLVGLENTHKTYQFTTLQDTKRIRFILYNYETDSYTIYKNIEINDINGTYNKKMERFKYIPDAIANRIQDINVETKSASLRITFIKDGLDIIKDYPLLGAGGGAWKNLYRQYQSIPYNSTETHNYYVQYGTEVGIIGIILLVILLIIFLFNMYKAVKTNSEFVSLYISVLLLLLHSTLDFNLSLVAVGYILWLLMGVLNGDDKINRIENRNFKKLAYPILISSIVITLLSFSINYGIRTGGQAAKQASGRNIDKAIKLYEKAIKFDKFNVVYRFDLAQIMNNELRKTKKEEYFRSFMDQIAMIRKYEPYNHTYTPTICSMYLAIGRFEEASALSDRYLADMPMIDFSYNMKIDVNYEIASFYLKDERLEEAMPYLMKVMETKEQLDKLNQKLNKSIKLDEEHEKKIKGANRVLEMIKEDLNK